MRSFILLVTTAALLAAVGCGGDSDGLSQADCLKTPIALPTGDLPTAAPGQRPQARCGITIEYTAPFPTATPDASNALPPAQALAQLLDTAGVGPALEAALDGDVEGLLALVDWQDRPCGLREGSDACPEGVAVGTALPSVNTDGAIDFWAREETIRAFLDDIFLGPELSLTFASADGPRYYVGLQGEPQPVRSSIIFGDAETASGVFLVVDASAAAAVVELQPLTGEGPAALHAAVLGYTDYDIIAYVP